MHLFVGPQSEELDFLGAFLVLSAYKVNHEYMWGKRVRLYIWIVKYYLFCRKLSQSPRETCLPVVYFSLLFYKLAFCMSSLSFDCYLNALSVCSVPLVNLL